MTALKTLFGEVRTGRVKRLPLVLYITALHLSLLAFSIFVGVSAGLLEPAGSGDIEAAQPTLSDWLGPGSLLLTTVFFLTVTYVNFNLLAKRIRDIGLPGWTGLLGYVVVRGAISWLAGTVIGVLLDLVFILVLALVPSDWVAGDSASPRD